jgi:hypothetical protein
MNFCFELPQIFKKNPHHRYDHVYHWGKLSDTNVPHGGILASIQAGEEERGSYFGMHVCCNA